MNLKTIYILIIVILKMKKIIDKFDELKHKNLYKLFPDKNFCNNTIKNRCLAIF